MTSQSNEPIKISRTDSSAKLNAADVRTPSVVAREEGAESGSINKLTVQRITKITDTLYLGNFRDAENVPYLKELGVRSILKLEGVAPALPKDADIALRVFRLKDGAGNSPIQLRMAVAALEELHDSSAPVLVACHAGRSRSPIVVAAFLSRLTNEPSADIIQKIALERELNIAPALRELMRRFTA